MLADPKTGSGRFARMVVVVSIVGAGANLGAAVATPSQSQAVLAHSGGSLGVLVAEEPEHVANRYQLYAELRDLAAGGRITVPRTLLDAYVLEHLSTLETTRAVNQRRVGERVIEAITPQIRIRGVTETAIGSRDFRDYLVAAATEAPEQLEVYVTRRSGTIVVLDRALADQMGLP